MIDITQIPDLDLNVFLCTMNSNGEESIVKMLQGTEMFLELVLLFFFISCQLSKRIFISEQSHKTLEYTTACAPSFVALTVYLFIGKAFKIHVLNN